MQATERMSHRAACAALLAFLLVAPGSRPCHAAGLPRIEGAITMEQAVDLAVRHNLKIRVTAADAQAMESMRREALAPFWPQVSANGYFADQRMAPNVYGSAGTTMARNSQVFNADQTRDANVTGMYALFSGGRDWYGYQAATRRAEAGRSMVRASEVDAAMQARLDYIAALRESENARVAADLLRAIEERLRVTRQAYEAGRVPRYYLLRDEAEQANAIQMLAMARSRTEQAVVALKATLGVELGSPITLTDTLEVAPITLSVEEAIREAAARHPEIQAAAKQRGAAASDIRAAYGSYFPQVAVSYMYDWGVMRNRAWESQADAMRSRSDSAEGYSVGVVVTLPLFDGFMRENALKTAKAKHERAAQTEALVRQQIARDVTQAALMLGAAEQSVRASGKGLEKAEEEYRVVKERFASGRGIQLEILDSEVALTRARLNVVNALADHATAVAMWRRANGEVR